VVLIAAAPAPVAFTRWLGGLDAEQLADILARRPDASAPPTPGDLAELAERLFAEDSVAAAFATMVLPAIQLIEAMQALQRDDTPGVELARLAALLGVPPDDHGLCATLEVLADWALVWVDGDLVYGAPPLSQTVDFPLALGRPAQDLLRDVAGADLRRIAQALGLSPKGSRANALAEVVGALEDADFVRTIAAAGPAEARGLLAEVAHDGPLVEGYFATYLGGLSSAATWAAERGLIVPVSWSLGEMPREVALALRGPDWHAPFQVIPPAPQLAPVENGTIARATAASATLALEQISALLDNCAAHSIALLKTGGVGVREVRRLAAASGAPESTVHVWLEVVAGAGLIAMTEEGILATEAYDEWLASSPAERLATLVHAWLLVPAACSLSSGGRRPLAPDPLGSLMPATRVSVLRVLRSLPPGLGVTGSLSALVTWHAPLLLRLVRGDGRGDLDAIVSSVLTEATMLGLVAHGAPGALGTAVIDGTADADQLVTIAERMVAPATGTARFQADLTVVVAGTPSSALAALLDSCAERESRGAASIWRFSAESVRRALDNGQSTADLLERLASVAVGGTLPQPLTYLFRDSERRHGHVRVRAAGCVIRCDDAALLAEIAAVRSLRPLHLSLVAPTVLVSARPPAETLAGLRAAGYAPVAEDASGSVLVERTGQRRASGPRRSTLTRSDSARSDSARSDSARSDSARSAPSQRGGKSAVKRAPAKAAKRAAMQPEELAKTLLAASADASDSDAAAPPSPAAPSSPASPATPGRSSAPGAPPAPERPAPARRHLRLITGGAPDEVPEGAALRPDQVFTGRGDGPGSSGPSGSGNGSDGGSDGGLPGPRDASPGQRLTATEAISRAARHLPDEEVRLLANAVEQRRSIGIEYLDTRGRRTYRTIEALEIHGPVIEAWCQLRQDDRAFALSRIKSVFETE
jgi:hypothetical protein